MAGLAPVSEEHRKETHRLGVWLHGMGPTYQDLVLEIHLKNEMKGWKRGRTGREGAAHEASTLSIGLLFILLSKD